MLEIFQDGGLLMLPIAFCSVVAMAICLERWWSLRRAQVLPERLLARWSIHRVGRTAVRR